MLEPIIEQLQGTDDLGMVKITLGDIVGYVSSFHLIEPKVNQMRRLLESRDS